MTRQEINQALAEALASSLNAFAVQHPATWAAICRKANNNPGEFFWMQLQQDGEYRALLNKTETEIKMADILRIAMSAIFKFAPLLLGAVK